MHGLEYLQQRSFLGGGLWPKWIRFKGQEKSLVTISVWNYEIATKLGRTPESCKLNDDYIIHSKWHLSAGQVRLVMRYIPKSYGRCRWGLVCWLTFANAPIFRAVIFRNLIIALKSGSWLPDIYDGLKDLSVDFENSKQSGFHYDFSSHSLFS